MNIGKDTLASFGYLEKSLKMTRRAIEKNQSEDGTTDVELDAMKASMQRVLDQINIWKAPVAPATPVTSTASTPDPLTDNANNADGSDGSDLVQ